MRLRSILLSTALVMSTAGVSHAIAASSVLKPQGNWAVTKVAAKSPGSAPYCALARRYGNGSVVTFARNENNETSVAVDFPPGSFKPSRDYTIVLDPGAGETRSYKTQPVSERGIVIRMGRDEKFYTALESTGKLGISVDDQSYTYSMSDLKNGTQDLSACLGTAVEPAAGDSARETPPLPRNKNQSKTEKMVEDVMPSREAPAPGSLAVGTSADEAQSLKEENIRLRNALERERRTYEDKMQQAGNSSSSAELSEKVQLLQSENIELKDKLKSVGPLAANAPVAPVAANCKDSVDPARFEGLKAENTRLKTDLETSQKQAAAVPAAAPAVKGDDKEVVALRSENTQLKSDLDIAKKNIEQLELARRTFVDNKPAVPDRGDLALVKTLKDQVATLESENSKLKLASAGKPLATSDDMKAGVASIAKMHTLEEQLKQVSADRDRLSNQIQSMKLVSTGPSTKISSDNWNLEQATQRYNEAEREIQRLGSIVETERAKCIVEKKNIEYMLFDPKIANKEQIAKLVTLENQLAEAKQGIDNGKDKSIQELKAQLADAQKMAAAGGVNDKAVADLKAQLSAANDKVAMLQKSVDDAKTQNVAANDKAVTDLKMQLTASNDQVAQLKKNLDDATRQQTASVDQAAVVNTLKQEIVSLNNQMANMQAEKTASAATRLANVNPAAGGNASRLSARPETVVPAVQVDTDGLPSAPVALLKPASVQPVDAAPALAAVPSVAPVASAPLKVVTPSAVAPVQSIATSVSQNGNAGLASVQDVKTLLSQAGLKVTSDVTPVANGTSAGKVSYRWQSEGLFGTIEQRSMDNPTQYENFVQDYIGKTKSRCKGQFAAVPGMVNMNGGTRVAPYEIACVDDKSGDGASASVVFYSQGQTFTTIAHEASSDSMDVAMDARDKVITAVEGSKTAAK